eukprot:TRINITY_DN16060_c0_g1_i3.p1 TRINITY_DN16060_c0_g1~~TRINITY_DN16060_c0_g1_i3.p1  ORF type:complete len:470 (+),score=46.63 TRINITY_DN16060_c0_g1_i3:53-1411(+)
MTASRRLGIFYSFLAVSLAYRLRDRERDARNLPDHSSTCPPGIWEKKACNWNGDKKCYTCGARIEWVAAHKIEDAASAKQFLALERPNDCRGCVGSGSCPGDCLDRIKWVMGNPSHNIYSAGKFVAHEFPSDCGDCGIGGGNTDGLGGTEVYDAGGSISSEGYSEVWFDDFEILNTSKWDQVDDDSGGGNNELQYYTRRPENARVSLDGYKSVLNIVAKKEAYLNHQYTSAKLLSKKDWLYGKFSVRARLNHARTRGIWPAIWLLPTKKNAFVKDGYGQYGKWPNSGEIDIFEYVAQNFNKVHGTVHTGAYNHLINTQKGSEKIVNVEDFHTYTVEWREDMILFAVDDDVYFSFKKESDTDTSKWPFKEKFYLILNFAVGGDWGGAIKYNNDQGVDENAFAQDQIMQIDWVRVEQILPAPAPAPIPPPVYSPGFSPQSYPQQPPYSQGSYQS